MRNAAKPSVLPGGDGGAVFVLADFDWQAA